MYYGSGLKLGDQIIACPPACTLIVNCHKVRGEDGLVRLTALATTTIVQCVNRERRVPPLLGLFESHVSTSRNLIQIS